MSTIRIGHLYPSAMNIYGDLGNIITLVKRLEWRGIQAEVVNIEPGDEVDWHTIDILFGGGGQDSGQFRISEDLRSRGANLIQAVEDGLPVLVVCGLYQLFGHEFVTEGKQRIEGIGLFDMTTTGGAQRMIGNVVVESPHGMLVGFENHSGETVLARGQGHLGRVTRGFGNNSRRKFEGAIKHYAVGTYLHGPVLPKNPVLADHLIQAALLRRGMESKLSPLDDRVEQAAAASAMSRPQ
jgi:CobQ-like glutamine amidotransferase family enzyme